MTEPELIPEPWTLGQCVYTMSTGKRCQKQATVVLRYGSVWSKPEDLPAYGYCGDHYFSVTKPRDPRIHRPAEPLTKVTATE